MFSKKSGNNHTGRGSTMCSLCVSLYLNILDFLNISLKKDDKNKHKQ